MIPIKVYGTPCGGTQFMERLLRAMGYNVGHERLSDDGIICGFMALGLRPLQRGGSYTSRNPGEGRPEVDLAPAVVTAHIIRHPLVVAETLWRYVGRQRPCRLLMESVGFGPQLEIKKTQQMALRWWVLTHEAIEAMDLPGVHVLRLGEDRTDVDTILLLEEIAKKVPRSLKTPPLNPLQAWQSVMDAPAPVGRKAYRKPRPRWIDWFEMDEDFAKRAAALLRRYEMTIDPWGLG